MNKLELYRHIIGINGPSRQVDKAIEELSQLIIELTKCNSASEFNLIKLLIKIAQVETSMEILKYLYDKDERIEDYKSIHLSKLSATYKFKPYFENAN
jgi:hypothetical protein